MNCVNCGAELSGDLKFCESCGAPTVAGAFCTNCGAALKPGASFCGGCGTPVKAEPSLSAVVASQPVAGRKPAAKRPPRVSEKPRGSWLKRLGLVALGLLLFVFGLSQVLLLVAGETRSATVTGSVERTRDTNDRLERYYQVSYRFTAPDGATHTGSYDLPQGNKLPPSAGTSMRIKYLSFFPSVNARDDGLSLSVTGLLLMAVGAVIVVVSFRR